MHPPRAEPRPQGGAGFPVWLAPAERLRFLLRWAVLAPSRHNTQPWLFDIAGPELRIASDPARALRVADPAGRERAMACGAALENVRIAAACHGHATTEEILRRASADGELARLRLEELRPPSEADRALFEAIPTRRTNRKAYGEGPLPSGLVALLTRVAAEAGATLRPVEWSERSAVTGLIAEADRLEWADAAFRAELADWSRGADDARADGLPPAARLVSAHAAALDRVMLRLGWGREDQARRDRQQALHGPALLALSTSSDLPADWVRAGQALQRVWLTVAAAGLAASPYSAPIGRPRIRARLREVLCDAGAPQALFRIGWPVAEAGDTPRRSVDAVVRFYAAEAASHPLAQRP